LKTKNIQLVPYKKRAFQEFANKPASQFTKDELPKEIAKLKIDPPKDFHDNHSIANEWAIHQWAKMIECEETEALEKVFKNVNSNLYFKYLRTIFPLSETGIITPKELEIKYDGNPKILLIDDEAEKGWNEILACLLTDLNNLYSDSLGEDFRNLSGEEIINRSIKKIIDDDIDVVLLDFRLNSQDHEITNPEQITSVKLLKKIKEINPGIQVINFSVTNKIWNLQQLQQEGADGFVFKGSPENNGDKIFINKNIKGFITSLVNSINKLFLKDFYKLIFLVEENLLKCDYEDDSLYQDFIKDLLLQLKLIGESGKGIKPNMPITIDVVFLNIYNFIEKYKNFYLVDKDHKFYLGLEEIDLRRYRYTSNNIIDGGIFFRSSSNDYPSWYQCIVGILVDYFQVLTLEDKELEKVWLIKDWRNSYIHNDKSFFSASELLNITRLMVLITSRMKE
jgi:CheY-like chemotaxis protein